MVQLSSGPKVQWSSDLVVHDIESIYSRLGLSNSVTNGPIDVDGQWSRAQRPTSIFTPHSRSLKYILLDEGSNSDSCPRLETETENYFTPKVS